MIMTDMIPSTTNRILILLMRDKINSYAISGCVDARKITADWLDIRLSDVNGVMNCADKYLPQD